MYNILYYLSSIFYYLIRSIINKEMQLFLKYLHQSQFIIQYEINRGCLRGKIDRLCTGFLDLHQFGVQAIQRPIPNNLVRRLQSVMLRTLPKYAEFAGGQANSFLLS